MIFSAIFILVILIGISLLVAVVGSSLLKKHARKAFTEAKLSGNTYRAQLKQGYEKRVEQVRAQTPWIPEKQYTPPETMGLPKKTQVEQGGKWLFILFIVIAVLIFSSLLGFRTYRNFIEHPRVYLCEGIDYVKMKPIGKSNTFIRGNVTVLIKSHNSFDTDNIQVEIYRIDQQGFHSYIQKKIPVKPEWTYVSFKVLFDEIGTYRAFFFNGSGNLIFKKDVEIVPDSYVFKPVPAK